MAKAAKKTTKKAVRRRKSVDQGPPREAAVLDWVNKGPPGA